MTGYQKIACPNCGGHQVVKAGYNARGERRYRCENPGCPTKSFMLSYRYKAYEPGIKETVVERAINSSGIRDTARVLGICFSKDEGMHDTMIGLLINKVEFGMDIHAKIQV